jgi:carbohydrate diacid regulator
MFDKHFAEMFIENISKQTNYCWLVFSREGIIIAATEKERVGVFHEASYKMMKDGSDMIMVTSDDIQIKKYLGVKTGIDMPIVINNETVGGIGITGNPVEVKPLIIIAKMTIEAMLAYENYKEDTRRKNDDKEVFNTLILNRDIKDSEQLNSLAKKLCYATDVLRIATLFYTKEGSEYYIYNTISQYATDQDFLFVVREKEVVLFKNIAIDKRKLMIEYKKAISDFLAPICEILDKKDIYYEYYIGSFQRKLENYQFSYKHCLWLQDNRRPNVFFYEYAAQYMENQVPMLELNGVFSIIEGLFDENTRISLIELVKSLKKNNYNLAESSKDLSIHKNTLTFRLKKVKDLLNINPLHSIEDRDFLGYLCVYMDMLYPK